MIGISKEFLESLLSNSNEKYKMSAPYVNAQRKVIQALINECREQDPWLPIEDAPKDRYIRVFAPAYDGLPALQQVCRWHESAGFCIDKLRTPTHYKELDDEPSPD